MHAKILVYQIITKIAGILEGRVQNHLERNMPGSLFSSGGKVEFEVRLFPVYAELFSDKPYHEQ